MVPERPGHPIATGTVVKCPSCINTRPMEDAISAPVTATMLQPKVFCNDAPGSTASQSEKAETLTLQTKAERCQDYTN